MTAFEVHLYLMSDWRVGTGTGRHGQADRLIARDQDGLPFVPAKTLVGVWRDACEIAATALDGGVQAVWHEWVEFLFGSQPALSDPTDPILRPPCNAALTVSDVRLHSSASEALRARPAVRAGLTFLKTGIAVDARTGRVKPRALRFDEMARAGLRLTARAEIVGLDMLSPEQQRCATSLLGAGARLLEGVGGGRRRGAGRCRLTTDGLDTDLDWLESTDEPPHPPLAEQPRLDERLPDQSAYRNTEWECARLRLELLTPVAVAERTVGNAVRSADYIPGRLLLPAILGLLKEDAAHVAARGGGLVVTDATVEINGVAGRPAPAAIVCDKTDPGWLCNELVETRPAGFRSVPVAGYLGAYTGGEPPRVVGCRLAEYTHNSIADDVQRPTEDIGGLYTYQAIAPGTVMQADVRIVAGTLPRGWIQRLDSVVRLGRARKAGYGQVRITAGAVSLPEPHPAPGSDRISVWLLSDLLVYDTRLRPSTRVSDIARTLGDALGASFRADSDGGVQLAGEPAEQWTPVAEPRRTESWHTRWGLARPTLLGVAAGTCLTFQVASGTLAQARIAEVETAGIGLRRAEGFGQVRMNDPLLAVSLAATTGAGAFTERASDPPYPRISPTPAATSPAALTGDAHAIVRIAERASWTAAIRERAEALSATAEGRSAVLGKPLGKVPPTQLANLRSVAGRADRPGLRRWLESLKASDIRRRAWPASVREHLTPLLTDHDTVWRLLDLDEESLCATPDSAVTMRQELWDYALQILVSDCVSAHQRQREHERSQ